MEKRDIIFMVLFLILLLRVTYADVHVNTQKQIIAELLQNYSSCIKPRKNLSEPVVVNLTFHFTSLREIDERLQTMSFIGWMELSWIDEFLILKHGVESVQLPKSEIWHPDVALFNSIDDPLHITDGQYIVLLKDGHVVWYPARQYSVRCEIDVRRFPFDVQKCQIRIGAWQVPVWVQVIVDTGKSLSDADEVYEKNGEWEIIRRITQPKFSSKYSISYVVYEVHFRRLSLYPAINTLFPVVLLSFLNPLVFLLPANSGEKMTLCISVLLSFTVFLTVFNDMMPKMSTSISYLSIYLCIQLGLSGLAVVESIFIWRVSHGENKTSPNKSNDRKESKYSNNASENSSFSTLTDDGGSEQGPSTHEYIFERYKHHSTIINEDRVKGATAQNEPRSGKRKFFGSNFRNKYSWSTERTISEHFDRICFWLHLCITSVCTTILFFMFLY